jgi:hypothetical protein
MSSGFRRRSKLRQTLEEVQASEKEAGNSLGMDVDEGKLLVLSFALELCEDASILRGTKPGTKFCMMIWITNKSFAYLPYVLESESLQVFPALKASRGRCRHHQCLSKFPWRPHFATLVQLRFTTLSGRNHHV